LSLAVDSYSRFVEANSASVDVTTADVCSRLSTYYTPTSQTDINDLSVISIQRKERNVRNATEAADATTAAVLAFWPLTAFFRVACVCTFLRSSRALRWMESTLYSWYSRFIVCPCDCASHQL